ncbi:lasso RiPP family leader peptide-containing protein [Jannaschia sp. R86511]
MYEAPSFEVVGTVRELTLGASSGSRLDQSFPSGTAFGDLTFS